MAQESNSDRVFKKFKTDVSLGYAIPKGAQSDGGALFAIEPKYAITDQCSCNEQDKPVAAGSQRIVKPPDNRVEEVCAQLA